MLTMSNSNINFNATSKDSEGNELATMSATSSGDNIVYFTLAVAKDAADVNTDFESFKTKVLASVNAMKTE